MRSSRLLFFFSLLFASTSLGCTVDRLPPPAAPARELPPQEEPLPTESTSGLSRVVISTDVPSSVERYTHVETITHTGTWRTSHAVGREMLCAQTPCTVSLPYGDHELIFKGLDDRDRHSTTHVEVRRASTVVNHTLGQTRTHPVRPLGSAITAIGFILVITSVALAAHAVDQRQPAPAEAGPIALAGVGSLLAGTIIIAVTPTKVQEGATTQWTPSPAIAGATVTAGVKF